MIGSFQEKVRKYFVNHKRRAARHPTLTSCHGMYNKGTCKRRGRLKKRQTHMASREHQNVLRCDIRIVPGYTLVLAIQGEL